MRAILTAALLLMSSCLAGTVQQQLANGIPVSSTAITPSTGTLWIANGTAFGAMPMSGDATINSLGAFAIGSGKVTNTMLAGSIDLTSKVTGILPPGNGGTGSQYVTFTGPLQARSFTLPDASASLITSGNLSSITTVGTISSGVWNGSIIGSAYGGTANGFTKFTGPTTAERTFTLPDSSATIITSANLTGITATGTVASGTWNGSIIGSAYGGTANGFTKFSGPTTSERTFTLPDASATIITSSNLTGITATGTVASGTWQGTAVAATYGGTGIDTSASTGYTSLSSGTWSIVSATTLTAALNQMVGDSGAGGTKGLVPAPAAGTAAAGKFLKADGTWAVPAGSGVTSVSGTTPITSSGGATPAIALGTAAALTTADSNADVKWSPSGTTKKSLMLQGLASQTANVLECQTSTGVVMFGVSVPTGTLTGTLNQVSGTGAGAALTSGGSNAYYGTSAGSTMTTGSGNIHLGTSTVGTAITSSNEFVAGSITQAINNVYFGTGPSNTSPTAFTIHGSGALGGTDTNAAGAACYLMGGFGTGTGVGGVLGFKYPVSTTTGTTLGTASNAIFPFHGTLFTSITAVPQAANTGETSLVGTVIGTKTLDGRALRAGSFIRIKAYGILTTPPGGSATFTLKTKWGSTVLANTGAVTLTASKANINWSIEFLGVVTVVNGSSSTMQCDGMFFSQTGSIGTAYNSMTLGSLNAAAGTSSVTFDWTTSSVVDLTCAVSNVANNTITCNSVTCEVGN